MRASLLISWVCLLSACGSSSSSSTPRDAGDAGGGGEDADGPHATAIALSGGQAHTCLLREGGGEVDCWGLGIFGKRGLVHDIERFPTKVTSLDGQTVTAMASATSVQCVLLASGAVRCWGENAYGQLGNGVTTYSESATPVTGLDAGVSAIAAGTDHVCAIVAGAVQCWGNDYWSQIGDGGKVTTRLVPTKVVGLPAGITLVAPGGMHSCAALSDQIWCWGENAWSQMGDGSAGGGDPSVNIVTTPVRVSGIGAGVTDLSAGYRHTCAVVSGAAWCWGNNEKGQLGDGSNADRNMPVKVSGLPAGVTTIRAGYDHTCAIAAGAMWCWGSNAAGDLGDGSTTDRNVPVPVSGLGAGVTAISVGGATSCAIADGRTWCWGKGGSAIGNTTKEGSIVSTPSRVLGF
jgi:alpha-tubulin suppressor-like RCC1 family protein